VAYYADDTDDWRLSFVQMEYRTVVDEESGDVKAEEELTPVRYTFLVGANEPTHTPKRQFVPLLQSDELRFPPTLGDLKDAFDIEVVTDAFFEEYRSHYKTLTGQVKTALEADDAARAEFEDKGVTAAAFAEKLLGQLVFLYFLQKKGWLGVQRGDDWGEGPGDFLRQLYEGEYVAYDNFYQDLLEPLFYDALATDRGSGNYFGRLNCRIPFLNGGLFQPIHGVNRARVRLPLPNGTFGDIFDTFDRYNFTVREDEPLEKEVAVDPEMLGKVFEKMLDADQRKEKGAFYTPRDIVHYMCQQSLIDHLDTELNVRETPLRQPEGQQGDAFDSGTAPQGVLAGEDYNPKVKRAHLEALVRGGTNWIEHDTRVQESEATNGKYADHEAPQPIRRHAEAIDQVLASMKICDPAVGSGAFPVGMMQEVVQARRVLDTYIDDDTDRSAYALKRHAIQNTIHGVDIEPRAIDIARLRLWLSLVVDEEDFAQIRPLPNLRYKIVQGDALQQMERHVFNNEKEDRLHRLMVTYVDTAHPSEKERLQAKIDDLLGEGEFDFRLYFGTVFEEQGGFDVVIGNPPYVRQEAHSTLSKEEKKQFETYYGTADLYVYFIERGMQLLRERGVFCYIVNNKWMRAKYGEPIRKWLKKRDLQEIVDFGDLPVFANTSVYPCIIRVLEGEPSESLAGVTVKNLDDDLRSHAKKEAFKILRRSLHGEGWSLIPEEIQHVVDQIDDVGKRLADYTDRDLNRGIVTGCNDAFVIGPETRRRLIEEDGKSEEVIKPFLRGRNVERYEKPSSDDYVIFTRRGISIDEYPAVKNYLSSFKKDLSPKPDDWPSDEDWPGRKPGNYEWYEIQDTIAYWEDFEEPKILYPDLSKEGDFTLDFEGYYTANTIYILPGPNKYLVGLLNSSLMTFFCENNFAVYRGGYLRFYSQYVKELLIYEINEDNPDDVAVWDAIVDQVDTMLTLHAQRADATTDAERDRLRQRIEEVDAEIDRRVYEFYELGEEEIEIVEDAT
jgi:hypothetical protein